MSSQPDRFALPHSLWRISAGDHLWTLLLFVVLLVSPASSWSQPTCLGTATLTVFVRNLTNTPTLQVAVDGQVAPDAVPCDGPGVTSYEDVLTCTGSGLIRCGQETGLRPGSWVHRLRVAVPGLSPQQQAQRLLLVGGDATPASNALVWTAYPRTFVVGTTDADDLWNTFKDAAEYTRCNPGPALMTFSPDTFPGADAPQRIHLLPPAPSCTITARHQCKPDLTPDTCTRDGTADGRTAGLCFTADRIVVDALDSDAQPGGVILSVDKCGRQVLRVYGSDNVFRGLVLEGSQKANPTKPCQVDTVAFTGPAARRNRIEHSLIVGPTCGDAVSVDNGAGAPDDDGEADNEVVDCRIAGAEDKGVKADFGGVATVARSCLHDNRDGGIQSTLGGTVTAAENVVQHNVAGAAQNGLSVMGSAERSALTTNGNVVRFSGGRGLSVSDNAEAIFQNDYVEDSQFSGVRIETTTLGPVDVQPTARFHGVALVCNRHEDLTGTCSPSPGEVDQPCTTVEDCCTKPDGTIDVACVSVTTCTPGSFPRGFGVAIGRAPDHLAPAPLFGDALQPGRNAFTTNKNTPAGANFRVSDAIEPSPARGNQWEHCGTGSLCDAAAIVAQDLSAPDGLVDLGIPSGPRAGAPMLTLVAPARPGAGQIVRVYGDNFNAIEGNPFDEGSATPNCSEPVACGPDGSCPTGPCVDGICPCAIENPLVQQRNMQTGANRLRLKTKDGAVLATIYPDAVTPTMVAFRMPFDCFAPLTLEVAKRDPSGNRLLATTTLCDPSGCADQPPDAPCDDGNACTVDDHCDGAGRCLGGDALECDGPCLTCDSASGCVPKPSTVRCDDGDACTSVDHCSGDSNVCDSGHPVVCGGQCQTGTCDSLVGCLPKNADTSCSDGDACTIGDHCAGEGNVCIPGVARDCTGQCLTGVCDTQSGCVPMPAATSCADGNACTTADHCSGKGDVCVPGAPVDCLGQCLTGTCDAQTGCMPKPAEAPRSDSDACTVGDHCSGEGNVCVAGGARDCTGQCLTGACDAQAGCVPKSADVSCDDGNVCTVGDHCNGVDNGCTPGSPKVCSDTCLTGACDSETGCVPKSAGTVCREAASLCDVVEACDGFSPACPADVVADSSIVCRPAVAPCDLAETCDGTSNTCPADVFAPTSVVCRLARDSCDLDDVCTGTGPACPTFDHVKSGFDAVTCAFERSIAPASCAGVSVPPKVARLFGRAGKQVVAPSNNPRTARSHLCGAERKLDRALASIDRAARRHRRPLPEPCAADVRSVIADAVRRIAGTVSCRPRGSLYPRNTRQPFAGSP